MRAPLGPSDGPQIDRWPPSDGVLLMAFGRPSRLVFACRLTAPRIAPPPVPAPWQDSDVHVVLYGLDAAQAKRVAEAPPPPLELGTEVQSRGFFPEAMLR